MKLKTKLLVTWVAVFIIAVPLNLVFTTTVAAADTYTPTNSDYAMSTSVDLSNLSIYQVDNGNLTSSNITAKLGTTESSGPTLIMFLPDAQILSGSSPQAVLFTYNHLTNPTMLNLLSSSIPTITSWSSKGYDHLNAILSTLGTKDPVAKLYTISKQNSLDAIEQFSSSMAQRFSIFGINALQTTNSVTGNFSQSDFNNQIGQQATESLNFKDTNTLNGNTTLYDNISADTITTGIDPYFASAAAELESTAAKGALTTQQFNPSADQSQTQQTFYAGYVNFKDEAIDTPVKDFAIQALRAKNIYVSADQLFINYTSLNNIAQNFQISDGLRSHVLAPLNQTASSSSSLFGLVHINLNFLGFTFLSFVQPANAWGFSFPNISVNSIVNSATSVVKNVVSTTSSAIKTAVSMATSPTTKNLVKDMTGSAVNALMHNPITDTINGAGHAVSSFTSSIGNGLGSIGKAATDTITNTIKNPASLMNLVNPFGGIFSTIINTIKPLLPYIALGLGVVAVAVLAYFMLPRIIGGIILNKAKK